jgi:hypothetical protein
VSQTDREKIYSHLRSVWAAMSNNALLNELQDAGIVSDLCRSMDDVADCDLMRAYNLSMNGENRRAA